MLKIKFRYKDKYTGWDRWANQECTMRSVEECEEFYGLGVDTYDYEIISVEEVQK